MVAVLTVHLHLPACNSLKEKRSQIKPLLARLRREFNVTVAEMAMQDSWQESVICCAMIGNEAAHLRSALQTVDKWVSAHLRDGMILEDRIEIF